MADYATNHTYDDDGNEINGSRDAVIEILNEAHYLNINVIRTWVGMQGSDDSHWIINESGGHYNLFEVGEPGNYSEDMFKALDWVIDEASKRDIRLQLVFVNNWNDYGGMRWYVQKSPTTDKTYEDVDDYADPNYWVFHDQFYDDENCRQYFRNYINYTLNRNNTYSGVLYKDDPAIFAWLLANEPRAKSDGTGRSLIQDWTTNMTAYIKSIDSNHLVGLGIEGWGYVETWGEGTDMIADHNNTGVDFATYALHPDQWQYFAERSEHDGGGYVTEGTGTDAYVDWWTNDSDLSYNNRDHDDVPAYIPALDRYAYDNWVTQNVKWANDLGMPVLLQEAGYLTSHDKTIKDRFYEQMIHNFYNEGGDGLLFWTLNHDDYYYSTDVNGTMDDGYGFYLSDDLFLKNKSESIIDAINFTKYDNDGGSWIKELNNYKYDFILNIGLANNATIDNCSLYLNISNGTWSGYSIDQVNSSPIVYNNDYTFIKQFGDNVEEFYWYTQCCGDSSCINSTPRYIQVKIMTPSVSLVSPGSNASHNTNALNLIYQVTNNVDEVFLDISYCELYINNNLNKTDYTILRGVDQSFSLNFSNATYNWYIQCTDIDDNIGTSEIKTFTIDTTYPLINFTSPTLANATAQSSTSVYVNVSTSDANEHSAFIDWNRSLVGWWKFDEYNSTGIYDNSTYNNFGTFNGGLGTSDIVSGKRGMGLEFDGVDDYILVSDNPSLNIYNNMTVLFWMKAKPNGEDWGRVLKKNPAGSDTGWEIQQYSNLDILSMRLDTSTVFNQIKFIVSSIYDDNWHHISFTVGDGSLNGYRDGILNNTNSYSQGDGFGNSVSFPLYIGGVGNEFNGTLDEVMIFNRVLTPEEINASYQAGTYRLYKNFTDLSDGTYDYTAHVIDAGGNVNSTETREVTVDTTMPLLEFVNPSPNDKSAANSTSPSLNLSVIDSGNTYAFFDDGLVGWWRFEANMSDESGNNNHGTCTNCPANTTIGKFGKALEFDGVDDFIDIANNGDFNFSGDFSIGAWVKPAESVTVTPRIVQSRHAYSGVNGFDFSINSLGRLSFFIRNESGSGMNLGCLILPAINDSQWHYVVATRDSNMKVYVDGSFCRVWESPTGSINGESSVIIGDDFFHSAAYGEFNGSIDEVLIFNRSLSPTEIQALYNSSQYYLQRNLTDLDVASHTYTAQTVDVAGNKNSSTLDFSVVLYDEFSGETTDLSDIDISNITNLVIDYPSQGQINFSENINLSEGADINSYVNVSFNRIEINSSALPVLNKSATLFLYNLTFSNPRILRDGSICSSTICTKESYTEGALKTLTFNVNSFTIYSAEETPISPVGPGGGGGTSGVLPVVKLLDLKSVPESFNIPATVGITSSGKISLLNSGDLDLDIEISLINLEGIIQFDKTSLVLTPAQTEILSFKIIPPKEPGIYAGKIIFTAQGKELEIPLALNVNSEISLFDISIDISDKYKSIDIGEKLISQITLVQAGLQQKADVLMSYVIKDFDGNSYLEETETIMVFKQKSYEREFQTQGLPPGDYLIGGEVIYAGGVATASHQFKVKGKETYSLVGLLALAISILVVLILIAINYKKMRMLQFKKR